MATLGNFVSGQVLTAAELNAIGTYTSFTPTWTGLTVGDGTSTGYYCQINDLIHWSCELLFGSTTSITSSVFIDYPVTPQDAYQAPTGAQCYFDDDTGSDYFGTLRVSTTTSGRLASYAVSGSQITYNSVTSTVPFTWATGDRIVVNGVYRAA